MSTDVSQCEHGSYETTCCECEAERLAVLTDLRARAERAEQERDEERRVQSEMAQRSLEMAAELEMADAALAHEREGAAELERKLDAEISAHRATREKAEATVDAAVAEIMQRTQSHQKLEAQAGAMREALGAFARQRGCPRAHSLGCLCDGLDSDGTSCRSRQEAAAVALSLVAGRAQVEELERLRKRVAGLDQQLAVANADLDAISDALDNGKDLAMCAYCRAVVATGEPMQEHVRTCQKRPKDEQVEALRARAERAEQERDEERRVQSEMAQRSLEMAAELEMADAALAHEREGAAELERKLDAEISAHRATREVAQLAEAQAGAMRAALERQQWLWEAGYLRREIGAEAERVITEAAEQMRAALSGVAGRAQVEELERLRARVTELEAHAQVCTICPTRKEASARARRLEAAIRQHRKDTWGEGSVEHDNDAQLYAALEER